MKLDERRANLDKKINYLAKSKTKSDKPNVVNLAKNLSRSIKEAFEYAMDSGDILVEEEEFLDRMDTCVSCDIFDPVEVRCDHESCGCYLKVKARMASTYCPLYMWEGDLQKAQFYSTGEEEI